MKSIAGVVGEFKFAPGRKYRADFAIPHKRLLVEYEGINSKKSRHTSITGYTNDCKKYNLAAALGYRVFRYTALNYQDVVSDITNLFIQEAEQS